MLRDVYQSRWVRYAISLGILGVLVWRVQPQKVAQALTSVQPRYLVFSLLLTFPFLFLKALRWDRMLVNAGVSATFGEATISLLAGMGLALVTPARLGELVRGAYLRDGQKLKIGGLVLLDKGFDVLVLCALSVAGAWVLLGPAASVGLAGVTIVGLLAVYWPHTVQNALHHGSRRLPGQARVQQVLESLDALSVGATTTYLVLTILSFAVVLLQFGLVLLSWRGWSFDIVFLTFPLVVLTNVLPITVGGLGVREGAAVLLLSHYDVSAAHAALAAFLMFFINTALPGLVGALLPAPAAGIRSASLDTT